MANWFHRSHLQQLCGGCFQDPAWFLYSTLSFAETKKQWNFHARRTKLPTNILYPQRSLKFFENNYFNVILTGKKSISLGLLFRWLISLLFTEKEFSADFPLCILLLIKIHLQTPFIFSEILLEANQGGQRIEYLVSIYF